MNPSSKTSLVALLTVVLAACGGKAAVKPSTPAATLPSATATTGKPPVKKPETGKSATDAAAPKDTDTQFKDALAALKAKDLSAAREGFAQLAKEHPELSGPLTNLGMLDAKANNRDAAIADFSRAVVANPSNAVAFNWLGILHREAGDYARAEQDYQKALALKPDNASVVFNLAILYDLYLKRPPLALARYREYQQMTGGKDLKVTAWIKALEAAGVTVPPPTPATLPTKPPAPAPTKAPKAPKVKS